MKINGRYVTLCFPLNCIIFRRATGDYSRPYLLRHYHQVECVVPPISILNFSLQIRPCFLYKEEYNDCKSIKGRFHQYFIHGESIDCLQWKRDYDNCSRFEDNKDLKAAKAVIESEADRRKTRLKGTHYFFTIYHSSFIS